MQATNQTIQRSFNRSLVLQKVRASGFISRVDLSRAVGLEKSSITAIVGELVERGLLREAPEVESATAIGRKPVSLRLNGSFCCVLGLEVQPSRYQAVVLDLAGRTLHQETGVLNVHDSFEDKLRWLEAHLTPVTDSLGVPLAAVGIGLPGRVDPEGRQVLLSVPLGLDAWDFGPERNPWRVPVFLENDANCCAWATLLDGDPTGGGDFLALLLEFQGPNPRLSQESGVSLGLGVVLNGEVHYGHRFEAGEFRSLFWRQGHRSQTGIADKELMAIDRDPAVLDRYLEEILLNLIPISSILAPERILLCGEAGRAWPHIEALLKGKLSTTWLALPQNATRFEPSPRASEAVAVGAAARILHPLFTSRSLSKSAQAAGIDWDDLLTRFGAPRSPGARGPGA